MGRTKLEDVADDQLVKMAMDAALRAGRSNSGLCISAHAESDWDYMKALSEELKRRLRAKAEETTNG